VCSRRNDPSEPHEIALCVSALCIYSSLEFSHAFLMLYDIRSKYSICMLHLPSKWTWVVFKNYTVCVLICFYIEVIF
jgi:hypothetical protein